MAHLGSAETHAQDSAAPSASESENALQSIEVTATRSGGIVAKDANVGVLGEMKLIDAPFSVLVLSREILDNQMAAHYGDYLKNDPSSTIGNVPVGFTTLRGFAVGINGFLYDGLMGNLGLSDARYQLEGMERIEVLKGPSTFLYGQGTFSSLGGAINFIPKRPPDTPVRSVEVGYTGQALYGIALDLGDRFGADRQFGYRINLGYKDGEQAVDDYEWTHKAATLALDWRATRDLTFNFGLEYADNHYPRLQPFFILPAGVPVPDAPKASHNMSQPWDDFRAIATTAYLRADWTFAQDWSLTAQAMHSRNDRPRVKEARFGSINDSAGNAFLFGSEDESTGEQNSGQLLVHGKLHTGFVEHQLTIGLSASNFEQRTASSPLGVFATNIYDPVGSPEPPDAHAPLGLSQKYTTLGVLISDVLKFNEQWSALAGLRYNRLNVDNFNPATNLQTSSNDSSKSSPIGALMFKPTANSLLYLSYAEGLDQGGQAPTGTTNANQFLPPIVTKETELGAKWELAAVTLTAALFDLRKPTEYVDPATLTFVQRGEQQHRGLELTATGRVTRDLTIVAGTMLLDASVSSTGNAATEGNVPVGVAQFTANLWVEWRLPWMQGWFVNAGVFHSGKQYLDAANTQAVPSWTRFDIGARYATQIKGRPITIRVGIENVADKDYWAGAQSGILTLAEPRTLKLSARMDF